jgi:hypothetical protein
MGRKSPAVNGMTAAAGPIEPKIINLFYKKFVYPVDCSAPHGKFKIPTSGEYSAAASEAQWGYSQSGTDRDQMVQIENDPGFLVRNIRYS